MSPHLAQISAGDRHTCAVLVGGTVRCWGFGGSGRLGYGNTNDIGDNELVTPDSFAERQGQSAASAANMAKQIMNSEQVIITSQDVLRSALERVGVAKVYPNIMRDAAMQ